MSPKHTRKWYKSATCYQIWPSSFCSSDANRSGVGDLPGIISKLDYLHTLGVDLIWLSPVYDSPQNDMGYDVSNYEDIWPGYGTLQDMEKLILEVKNRGMRIIMDLVVNHTSSEHAWFKESRKSREGPYADWYHWRDPKAWTTTGEPIPPNNWRAAFGGSVWTFAPERQQFYLHLALPEQPDLNWFNDATRKRIYESAIEFWLHRGVDGFRVDVVPFYWKDTSFPDARILNPEHQFQPMEPQHILNGPRMHEWLREQRLEALNKYGNGGEDIVMVGELPGTSQDEVLRYIDPEFRELDMVFDFDLFMAGNSWTGQMHDMRRAKLTEIKAALVKTQKELLASGKGWTTAFLENHDNPRSIDKFGPGPGQWQVPAARMLALMLCCLSGTLFLYQGQEIGMSGVPTDGSWKREDFRDKATLRYLEQMDEQHPNDENMRKRAFDAVLQFSRDNARTPMQWSSSGPYAGFSSVEPWIKVNENFKQGFSVSDQTGKVQGVLEFWKEMLKLRKRNLGVYVYGNFECLDQDNESSLHFLKTDPETAEQVLVALNFSGEECQVFVPGEVERDHLKLSISSNREPGKQGVLDPWEGRIYAIRKDI